VLSDVAAAPDREARAPNRRRRAAGTASQRTLPSSRFRRFRQRAHIALQLASPTGAD